MASSKPPQERMVDPFASYNSNEVNRLTEVVGLGRNGMIGYPSLQVSANDSTSVIVSKGYIIKDDVLIYISESTHIVDFLDDTHYTDPTLPIPEVGYNYVVLDYTYVKSRPAPEATIKILKNSDRHLYTSASNLHLLKVVKIIGGPAPAPFEISEILDYDPDNIDNQRETIKTYAGARYDIPAHTSRYQGNFMYSSEEDDFVFGLSNRWVSLQDFTNATSVVRHTLGFQKGDLVFFNFLGGLTKAISTTLPSTADAVVTVVGTLTSSPPGRVQTTGRVEEVPIEGGGGVNVGDLLYLSLAEPGRVTSIEVYPFSQFVGRCLKILPGGSRCNMLFVRGYVSSAVSSDQAFGFSQILPTGSWIPDGGLFYQDINYSAILEEGNLVISARDTTSDIIIEPALIEIDTTSTGVVRIWMPDSTTELDITMVAGKKTGATSHEIEIVRDTLISGVSWTLSGGSYYQDIDISTIGNKSVVVEAWDASDLMKIKPSNLELIDANTLRVWMADNTHSLNVTVAGPKPASTNFYVSVNAILQSTAWTLSGGSYYQNVGIGAINNQNVTINIKDNSNGEKIDPENIEFLNAASVRIWMPNNTETLEVLVVG